MSRSPRSSPGGAQEPLPDQPCTVRFLYPERGENNRDWWLGNPEGQADLCKLDRGLEIDLCLGLGPFAREPRRAAWAIRIRLHPCTTSV